MGDGIQASSFKFQVSQGRERRVNEEEKPNSQQGIIDTP
jgi:hypothetical protein